MMISVSLSAEREDLSRNSSTKAFATRAISRTNFPAQTQDRSGAFSGHARQRFGPVRFQNEKWLAHLDCFRRGKQRHDATEQKARVRHDRAPCRAQPVRRNRLPSECANSFGGCPRRFFGG